MNADDQMERDWRDDQRALSKMKDASHALSDVLHDEHIKRRLGRHLEIVKGAQHELDSACAQIVRVWD